MNKTLTVALSMCAGAAIVGAGVFASSTAVTKSTSTSSTVVSTQTRQGTTEQFRKFNGSGDRVQSETIKSAIEANDYSVLSATEQSKITKDQFAQMVNLQKARVAHEAAILAAIEANDFAAFQKAQTDFKSTMDASKPTDAQAKDESRPEQTTAQQQEHFNELVSYYMTNGKLPQMSMGMRKDGSDHNRDSRGPMISDTIKSAIEANDYSKLSTDEQSKITQDQFAQMITHHMTNSDLAEDRRGARDMRGAKPEAEQTSSQTSATVIK